MSEFDKFVSALLRQMCESLSIDTDFINNDIAIRFQRHYNQAGPWADILTIAKDIDLC